MYLELDACQDISRIEVMPRAGACGPRGAWTGACGYPALSLFRGGLTFPAGPISGSAPGIGVWLVIAVVAARQWWRIEDGVPEQHELHRHGARGPARRIPAPGERVLRADHAVERLHQLRMEFPGLFRRHIEHARGAAQVVLEAFRPRRRRSETAARPAQHAIQPHLVES